MQGGVQVLTSHQHARSRGWRPNCFASLFALDCEHTAVCARVGGTEDAQSSHRWRGPPKMSRVFPLPHPFSLFLSFSGVFSWNFGGVLKRPALKCARGRGRWGVQGSGVRGGGSGGKTKETQEKHKRKTREEQEKNKENMCSRHLWINSFFPSASLTQRNAVLPCATTVGSPVPSERRHQRVSTAICAPWKSGRPSSTTSNSRASACWSGSKASRGPSPAHW